MPTLLTPKAIAKIAKAFATNRIATPASFAPLTSWMIETNINIDFKSLTNKNKLLYVPIHDNIHDNITPQVAIAIGIFIIPPYGEIPLHGHPEMTVLSKLLYGDVQLRSYQMLDTKIHSSSGTIRTFKQESSNSSILAKLSQDVIKQSGEVWGLYPDRNNVRLIQ